MKNRLDIQSHQYTHLVQYILYVRLHDQIFSIRFNQKLTILKQKPAKYTNNLVIHYHHYQSGFYTSNSTLNFVGSRHQTPDTADERVSDLPPRYYPRGGRGRRDNRRDDRRRTTDDEETVLDSQDVSSADRGESFT